MFHPIPHVSALLIALATFAVSPSEPQSSSAPRFDDAFWKTWGDGQAELSSYDLVFPRYGAPRKGTAVAIVVTETFDADTHVKREGSARKDGKDLPVLKLNLVEDFATGVYDYNLMTSVFVGLVEHRGMPAGALVKETFSAQEWCGHAWMQVDARGGELAHELHSYFEGEGDQSSTLANAKNGLAEDALLLWARGLAGPMLAPGEERTVPMLRSLATTRLAHVPLVWDEAALKRETGALERAVPAGTFECDVYRATIRRADDAKARAGGKLPATCTWTLLVERVAPRRVVRFENDAGLVGELAASARMKYWELNGPGGEAGLERLGLKPRPARTP